MYKRTHEITPPRSRLCLSSPRNLSSAHLKGAAASENRKQFPNTLKKLVQHYSDRAAHSSTHIKSMWGGTWRSSECCVHCKIAVVLNAHNPGGTLLVHIKIFPIPKMFTHSTISHLAMCTSSGVTCTVCTRSYQSVQSRNELPPSVHSYTLNSLWGQLKNKTPNGGFASSPLLTLQRGHWEGIVSKEISQ